MSAKIIINACFQAVLIQVALTQCTSRAVVDATYGNHGWAGPSLAFDGLTASSIDGLSRASKGLACDGIHSSITPAVDFTPTSGGGLVVTSGSPIAPTGISVVSDNAFEGALSVAGEVPFVGTTAVEGLMPAVGAGAINHSCGDGVTDIVSETTDLSVAAIAPESIAIASATLPSKFSSPSLATPIAPRNGLGLGNRIDYRGCGNRGLY